MVILGSQLSKSLVWHRHHPEVGKEVIEGFAFIEVCVLEISQVDITG